MQIDNTLLDIQNYIEDANSIKDIVLHRLLVDGIINDEQAIEYSEKWQVIVIKKSWFKKWTEKFSNYNVTNYLFKYVRFED